ncbi:unnamed protein product [Phytophthora fragariaefolia]|uniref:Unnamed protein product n=1 Tax=Phytophthora fragariaefolia TaxID=1490495 RepID=A0A9W6YEG5_9STRA|nr:unnamed protein product [Phytophthora fragariaefolia]
MERLFMVLKHKSAVFINLPMALAGYANNIIWLTFGSLIQNYFMISINIFFFTMNSITLVVYQIYSPKTHPLKDGWNAISSRSSKVDDLHIQVSVEVLESLKVTSIKSNKAIAGPPIQHHEGNHLRVIDDQSRHTHPVGEKQQGALFMVSREDD